MFWRLFAEERPADKSRVIVRDNKEHNFGQHNDMPLFYDNETNSFISPLGVSHYGCDMKNIVYWGYYKEMFN